MKSKYYKLAGVVSTFLVFVAATGITPTCAGWMYQQKIPKCLTKKK